MSNCLSRLSLSLPRACLHVNARETAGETTAETIATLAPGEGRSGQP
jgi:hypothetical protein